MKKAQCAHCRRLGGEESFVLRTVRRYRKNESLYFCRGADCYLKYMKARQSPREINQSIKNRIKYSNK